MSTPEPSANAVQRFSYKKAMNILSEAEKARLLCVMLTMLHTIKPTSADMKIAAAHFGSAEGGFAKSFSNHMKKLKDAECFIVEGEDLASIPTPQATPAKTPKAKATPKRKADSDTAENEGDVKTPAKKQRGRPKKSAAKVKEDSATKDELVKGEEKDAADKEVTAGAETEAVKEESEI